MNTQIMDESPLFQEWKARIAREAAREDVQLFLESRFGSLDPAFLAAIDAADTSTLRALIPHLATETLDQVRARLLSTPRDHAPESGTPPGTPPA